MKSGFYKKMINKNSNYNKNVKRIKMIDEEGTLILTNETKITDDIIDKVKKIVIDKSLEKILFRNFFENDSKRLYDLINLEEVDFSNYTFNKIFIYYFSHCKKLKSIELPSTIKKLKWYCFENCEQLESVILHGVEKIYSWVFYGCISLKYLFISDSIKEIDETAFDGIPKEQEIKIICPDRFYDYFKKRFPNANINENEFVLK
jgi:hypothetical protein